MEELSEVADNTPESVLIEKVIPLLEKAVAEFENYQGLQNKNLEPGGYLDAAQSKIVQVITNLRNRSASDVDATAMRGVKEARYDYGDDYFRLPPGRQLVMHVDAASFHVEDILKNKKGFSGIQYFLDSKSAANPIAISRKLGGLQTGQRERFMASFRKLRDYVMDHPHAKKYPDSLRRINEAIDLILSQASK